MKWVITIPMPTITYSRYETQKTAFFEHRTSPPAKLENNIDSEIKAMKKMMSLLSNKLMRIRLSSSRNQGNYPRQLVAQNNYSQNQSKNYDPYDNINNENNGIRGMGPSENGYGYNNVSDQPP